MESQAPEIARESNDSVKEGLAMWSAHEQELVRLYVELTGSSECAARAVYMQICCKEHPVTFLSEDGNP